MLPEPPQDAITTAHRHAHAKRTSFRPLLSLMSRTISIPRPPQAIVGSLPLSRRAVKVAAVDRMVVATVTWNGVGVELMVTEAGTVQLAAGGAPEQLNDTLPLNPGPPTTRL